MAQKLVNPGLYRKLCDVFGKREVRIHRAGRRGHFTYEAIQGGSGNESYMRLAKKSINSDVGEEFSVNCPFCGDTRGRLYFNHFWGTRNKYDGKRILWCCHCYNEECQSDFENRKELSRMILGEDRVRIVADTQNDEPEKEYEVKLPGILQPLEDLARENPGDPAIVWCVERGYDPRELGERYGVGFCRFTFADNHPARNRLVAPFYARKNGETKLAGWTARKIFEEEPGPKWLHSASPTGGIVYGLGEASRYKTIAVVEGPGDKWALGPAACAVLGKTLSEAKVKRICDAVRKQQCRDQVIAVVLDPKQSEVERRRGKEHHLDAAARALRARTSCPIVTVRLPEFTDPGGLDREIAWDYIGLACKAEGIQLSRDRIPKNGKNK